jgi:hypothetical protein
VAADVGESEELEALRFPFAALEPVTDGSLQWSEG